MFAIATCSSKKGRRLTRSKGIANFFFSSRRRHTRSYGYWSSDVCSSDLDHVVRVLAPHNHRGSAVDHRVPDSPCLVVLRVFRSNELPMQPLGELHKLFVRCRHRPPDANAGGRVKDLRCLARSTEAFYAPSLAKKAARTSTAGVQIPESTAPMPIALRNGPGPARARWSARNAMRFAEFATKTPSMTSGTDVHSGGENKAATRIPAVTMGTPIPREAAARWAGPRTRSLVPDSEGYMIPTYASDCMGRTCRFARLNRPDISGYPPVRSSSWRAVMGRWPDPKAASKESSSACQERTLSGLFKLTWYLHSLSRFPPFPPGC